MTQCLNSNFHTRVFLYLLLLHLLVMKLGEKMTRPGHGICLSSSLSKCHHPGVFFWSAGHLIFCILLNSYNQLCLFCISLTPCHILVIYLHFPYISCILLSPPRFIPAVFYLLMMYPSLFGQWLRKMQDRKHNWMVWKILMQFKDTTVVVLVITR